MFIIFKRIPVICLLALIINCQSENHKTEGVKSSPSTPSADEILKPAQNLSHDFKSYWFSGEAELATYDLEQVRYGQLRKGTATLIFVTEDFLPEEQVKAETQKTSNIKVLKLNKTKNFVTGIYPYTIMQSVFFPVANNQHAIKVSGAVQEWCGHMYAQINNREMFEISSHSYFQGEADQNYSLEPTYTENEIWTQLRLDPKSLPQGKLKMIPSIEFTQLQHKKIKPYKAQATLNGGKYTVSYPNLNRSLTINFKNEFPYKITSWQVHHNMKDTTHLLINAQLKQQMKLDYWNKNKTADTIYRKQLSLD